MIAFATDDQMAARLRPVEAELRVRGLVALADEIAYVLAILDPEPRP